MHTVLVVDDNEDLRLVMQSLLGDRGYAVAVASDGAEGLQTLATLSPTPCMIITDWMMPGMGGREFLGALSADLRWAHIPRMVLTASRGELDLGGTRVLLKPVAYLTLLQSLDLLCTTEHPHEGETLPRAS